MSSIISPSAVMNIYTEVFSGSRTGVTSLLTFIIPSSLGVSHSGLCAFWSVCSLLLIIPVGHVSNRRFVYTTHILNSRKLLTRKCTQSFIRPLHVRLRGFKFNGCWRTCLAVHIQWQFSCIQYRKVTSKTPVPFI
ncbi:hypothetical protein Tsp_07759 [Trichinella spiralis]|uniref:hypothetical protein n=1 Tax=Trichinella spiralis TaxID=6334 RepID=UPI0001EFCA10|nr:hypothetical protein Tsp_07759 [Trichinella spiralis]